MFDGPARGPKYGGAGSTDRREGMRFVMNSLQLRRGVRRLHIAGMALLAGLALSLAQPAQAQTREVPDSREEVMLSFAPVVKKAAPAVVNVLTKKKVEQERPLSSLLDDPFFRRFFGDDFGGRERRERDQSSLGSGVIVDPEGFIVTNEHVIKGASEIKVVLADRREFEAEVVLTDERTDLAVLLVDPGGEALPTLEMRDSDDVEVGDLVLAVGNPFGVGQTVTSGIVSALARTQVGITDFSFFIQTDAAINPGNSGGALVTLDGRLIGINTAIYSRSGGSIGIGFAIPANMVRTVVDSARGGTALVRAWAGLAGQNLTAELAEGLRLDRPGGVVISDVYQGGPADRAGIAAGDVIVAVNQQPVTDLQSLRYRVATGMLGSSLEVEFVRKGDHRVAALPLEAPPESPPRNEVRLLGHHPLGGAFVASLSPALSEELDIPDDWSGVVITKVQRGTPAHRVGFRPRDVILSLNGKTYGHSADLSADLVRISERWQIVFKRDGKVRRVEFSS